MCSITKHTSGMNTETPDNNPHKPDHRPQANPAPGSESHRDDTDGPSDMTVSVIRQFARCCRAESHLALPLRAIILN